jgi:hypothetical protein
MQAKIRAEEEKAQKKAQAEYERLLKKTSGSSRSRSPQRSTLEQVLGSKSTQRAITQVLTGIFGMAKRR